MTSQLGQGLRNNSNLPSRDTALQTAMSHQDTKRTHAQIYTKFHFMHKQVHTKVCVDSLMVMNDSIPIKGSISTGSWYCCSSVF